MPTNEGSRNHPATTPSLIILGIFTVALCWLGFFLIMANGSAGAAILLVVPLLATIGACLTLRGRRRAWTVSTRRPKHRFTFE